jgi:hypothetical protein
MLVLHLASNPLRRLVAVVTALSLLVCCCHAHFVMSCVPGSASPESASCCCAGCAEEAPAPPREVPGSLPEGCQVCCIKGSGQKDGGTVLLLGDAAMPAPALPAVLPPGVESIPAARPRVGLVPQGIAPPTLLRLHCALLI